MFQYLHNKRPSAHKTPSAHENNPVNTSRTRSPHSVVVANGVWNGAPGLSHVGTSTSTSTTSTTNNNFNNSTRQQLVPPGLGATPRAPSSEAAGGGGLGSDSSSSGSGVYVDYARVLRWARDVACAMNYLHAEAPIPIIHRDLKSKNSVPRFNSNY